MPSEAKRPSTARGLARIAEPAVAPEPGYALPVAWRYAGHEPRPENLLHFREPGITQRTGEPHDGRGLDLGPLRHFRDRAQGHVRGVVQRELGNHPEPVREARVPAGDLGAQGLIGVVRGRLCSDAHLCARWTMRCVQSVPWIIYFTSQRR